MEHVTRVKDRITYEEGCIKEYLSNESVEKLKRR